MELLAAVTIAAMAYIVGSWAGYRNGFEDGMAEEHVRQRIAALPKPWER